MVVGLMREQMRRKAHLTAESAARWFEDLAEQARRAKDYSAAARAKREAGLLLGLYPDPRLRIEHELIDSRGVTAEEIEELARLRHEVRPQLAARVVEAEFTSTTPGVTHESPVALEGPQNGAGVTGRSDSQRDGAHDAA